MTDRTPLLAEFSPPSLDEWKTEVERLLRGAPFAKKMFTKTLEGISVGSMATAADLPADGPAVLNIYDSSGHLVRRLHTSWAPAGRRSMTWDGTDSSGRAVASGVYLVRLNTQAGTVVAKCVLVR